MFIGLYSLVAVATFVALVTVYLNNSHAGARVWNLVAVPRIRPLAMLLAVVGIAVILPAVIHPSPALVGIQKAWASRGRTRITRHPLFMGIALWAFAHLLLNGFVTDLLFFGGLLAFSLIGAAQQDKRKRLTDWPRLGPFFGETSFWPFGAILDRRNHMAWGELPWLELVIGAAFALIVYALHPWMFFQ